jgi:serine/threonine protein kinase
MTQLAALEHLYHHQIIHRDIKAANILLCASDPSRLRLIDFGLARHLGADMKTAPKKLFKENKTILGTLSWCSQHMHEGFGEWIR